MNGVSWSAAAALSHPGILRKVHKLFLDAGAELLIANTFSAAIHNLETAGLSSHFESINSNSVRIAREVADNSPKRCVVAGSISTTTFTGSLDYSRLLSETKAVEQYAKQATIQVEAGAEIMILEMMRDIEQTALALEGALRTGIPVWVGFTCYTDRDGEVLLLDTTTPLAAALEALDLSKAESVGIMHTLIEHTPDSIKLLKNKWKGSTFAYPHAGRFEMPNWIFHDAITPDKFATFAKELLDSGIDAVGGCCGITPSHIRELSKIFTYG